jgi:hypothetical protein
VDGIGADVDGCDAHGWKRSSALGPQFPVGVEIVD